jgi:ribosomal protein S18 acetylase RimI-like enzyme
VSLPADHRWRPVDTEVDLPVAARILEACDRFDVGFADHEATWLHEDWRSSSFRGAWIVERPDGEEVAYATMSSTDPATTIDGFVAVLPPHRDELRRPVLIELEREARRIAVNSPTMIIAFASTEGAGHVAESLGFTFSRAFWHMERGIDDGFRAGPLSPGVAIRPYTAPEDDRLGWEVLEETFAGHYSIEPQSFEAYRADVLEDPLRDPSLAAFAVVDGQTAGIVVGRIVDDIGWIDDVGVRAPFRGRGIGRSLLEHGFELLAARGVDKVQLNVDSQNATGATRLYEGAGMTIRRSFDCFEKVLEPE